MPEQSTVMVSGQVRERPADARPPGRTAWVDAAKGLCIVLVVLHHTVMFLGEHGMVPGPLATLNLALTSLRMPLFFLASGLFLAPVVERPWRTVLHRRVALFAWLYAVWAVIQYAVITLLPATTAPPIHRLTPLELLALPLFPDPSMWFLYALALYSVLARLLRRVPGPVLLVATGVLSAVVGAGLWVPGWHSWELMARYAFFFVLGWHGRRLVQALAARTSPLRVLLAAVVAGGVAVGSTLPGMHELPGVALLLNVVAVTGGVLFAAELAKWRVGRLAVALGGRTLPIYLANVPLVALLTAGLVAPAVPASGDMPVPEKYALVAAMVAVVVLSALGLQRLLLAVGARWFYDLPGPWAVRAHRGRHRRGAALSRSAPRRPAGRASS